MANNVCSHQSWGLLCNSHSLFCASCLRLSPRGHGRYLHKTVYKQENQASFSLKLKMVVAGPLDGDHMRAFSPSCGFDCNKYTH